MPFYASPGIYVEEVPSGARPIGAVGTSTAGFVGTAPNPTARLNEAVAVNSWSEFLRIFASQPDALSTPLARGVFGFFDNGGGRCFVVNVAPGEPIGGSGRGRTGLAALEAIDEVAIVAAPGYADAASYEDLLSHCERLGDRVAILDPPAEIIETEPLTRVATVPPKVDAKPADKPGDKAGNGDAVPAAKPAARGTTEQSPALRPRQSDYGTFYVPWIVVRDPLTGDVVSTPPSGHVAGVWARTDSTRGVHKAPANEPIRGVVDLSYRITRGEQETLNPAGVNCIRYFPAEGVRIWGARTLAAEASEWRYLNVRRLFSMLKESIGDGTRWIVFEPNDQLLWRSIRRDIGAFLTRVWRDGALMGRTPAEAFFVKCDEETNPASVRDAGVVVAEIGVAPVKPAEFVVFKLSQSSIGSETESLEADMSEMTAAPAAQPGNLVDPMRSYNFKLLINGVTEGHFTEVTGLGVQVERIAYREGGNNAGVRAIPGRVTYAAVTLRFGLTSSHELWEWLMSAVEGRVHRRHVSIVMLDPSGATEVLRWNLINAWPQEWYGAPLNAMSQELAIESLVLAHEGLHRETGGGGPAA